MKMKINVLIVLMLSLFLGACSNNQTVKGNETNKKKDTVDSESSITIDFWNGFTGPDGEILKEIVDRFNKTNKDGIKINMDIMPWDQLGEKLPAAMTSNTAPPLILTPSGSRIDYAKNGQLKPLDDIWNVTGLDKSDFAPSVLDALMYDNQLYMMPMQAYSLAMYWNKDLFKEAGLDPENPPATWEEVIQTAEKLTDSSKNQYGMGLPFDAGLTIIGLMKAYGAEVVAGDDYSNFTSGLGSPQTLEAMNVYKSMFDKGVSPIGTMGDIDSLFYSGQMAMVFSGPWLISGALNNNINLGISLLPEGPAGTFEPLLSNGFSVTAGATEEETIAAYKFIEYWNSTEIVKEWSLKNGFPPYLYSVLEDQEIAEDERLKVMSSYVDYAFSPYPSNFEELPQVDGDILGPLFEGIPYGDDPETALKEADETLKNLLSEVKNKK